MRHQTRFRSFEVRRYDAKPTGPMQVQTNVNVEDVTQKDAVYTVRFHVTLGYGTLGIVRIEGDLILHHDEEVACGYESWKEARKLEGDAGAKILQAIMNAATVQAVVLTKDIGLPPPIPMPMVRRNQAAAATDVAPASGENQ